MNIDVKEKYDGRFFYSFAIEKGTAPQTLLAVVNESNSPTVPTDRVPQNEPSVKNSSTQKNENDFENEPKTASEKSEKAKEDADIRYSLFPGGVFPPYNKSHSDANERATRWAHNEDIETGAQRIFFYKGDAYLVEKFDSMDLGYLVMKKLSKSEVQVLDRYDKFEEGEIENGENYGKQHRRNGTLPNSKKHQEGIENPQRSGIYDYSSDRHNGETAEVQGMDREQDGKRSSEHDGSRDNEHSVEDREREVKYNLSGKKKGDEDSGHEQNSNSEELGWNKNKSETEAYNRVGEVGHTQSEESNTPHTKRIHRSGVSAETLTSSGLTAEQAALREQNRIDGVRSEFYTKAKLNGEEQVEHFNTEKSAYYPDVTFERNDISVPFGGVHFLALFYDFVLEMLFLQKNCRLSLRTGGT